MSELPLPTASAEGDRSDQLMPATTVLAPKATSSTAGRSAVLITGSMRVAAVTAAVFGSVVLIRSQPPEDAGGQTVLWSGLGLAVLAIVLATWTNALCRGELRLRRQHREPRRSDLLMTGLAAMLLSIGTVCCAALRQALTSELSQP